MPAPTGTDMATTTSSATGKQQEEEEVVSQKVHAVLEDSPEYREALARSKRIEEDLQVIRAGTQLWKVRSFSKWFHRKFFIDGEEGHLKYEPSHKNSCIFGGPEFIAVTDIVDVRRGWKTDTFNKFGSKVVGEQKKHKLRRQRKLRGAADSGAAGQGQDDGQDRPLVDEACCFSIVYGDSRRTLDLVASTPQVATVWVRALRHVVTVLRGLNHEKRFVVWLQKQFEQADVDRSGTLSFDECLHLLQQLNVKMSKKEALRIFMLADTNKQNDEASGEPCLDAEEFIQFYQLLMKRPDIEEIYHQYARSAKEMTPEELQRFLKKEQHMAEVTVEECRSMIDAFEQSELKNSGRLSISAFQHLLISEQFAVMDYRCKSVYQDMDEPLSSYFIATSHNTYLLGRQVVAESSIEGYVSALRRGCRLLELDCWDGPDGEPVVTHGYALTSKLVFREVLKDAILPNAFAVSEYPVILSLENHCTPTQQKRLAFHITDIFGDLLYLEEMSPDMETLPSPNQLKRRIIIKGRKAAPVQTPESESEDEDEMDSLSPKKQPPNNQSSSDTESSTPPTPVLSGRPSPPDNVTKSSKSSSRRKSLQNSQLEKVTDQNLSDLVNVCQGVHFHGFKEPGNCYEMVSLSESKATKLLEKNGDDLVRFNTRRLSKVYPSGTRTGSTNFMPWPFWNGGCQLVALNYQGSKEPVFINEAKFRDNGGCGFVLKPDFMRLPDFSKFGYNPTATSVSQLVGLKDRRRLFEIRIISGLYIPKPEGEGLSDIVDPYVKVKIIGHPIDKREKQTHVVHDNGFNPRWNSTFKFVVNVPELAFLYFIVKDETPGRHDPTVGSYALPFTCIAPGYRQVPLLDMKRRPLGPAHLFIHTKITEISY